MYRMYIDEILQIPGKHWWMIIILNVYSIYLLISCVFETTSHYKAYAFIGLHENACQIWYWINFTPHVPAAQATFLGNYLHYGGGGGGGLSADSQQDTPYEVQQIQKFLHT